MLGCNTWVASVLYSMMMTYDYQFLSPSIYNHIKLVSDDLLGREGGGEEECVEPQMQRMKTLLCFLPHDAALVFNY